MNVILASHTLGFIENPSLPERLNPKCPIDLINFSVY